MRIPIMGKGFINQQLHYRDPFLSSVGTTNKRKSGIDLKVLGAQFRMRNYDSLNLNLTFGCRNLKPEPLGVWFIGLGGRAFGCLTERRIQFIVTFISLITSIVVAQCSQSLVRC